METVKVNPILEPSEVKGIEYANEPENNPNPESDPSDESEYEFENDSSDESEYNLIDESESDSRDESENNPLDESNYLTSFNAVTLNEMKEILYELREYFDELKIELVPSPNITEETYTPDYHDRGNMKILEIYNPRYHINLMEENSEIGDGEMLAMRAGRNYFFDEEEAGMVFKIRAMGRKTNFNMITLIQRILHERFWFKIGLGGVLKIEREIIIKGIFMHPHDQLTCRYVHCNVAERQMPMGAIVNDPVEILGEHEGLFYTHDRYLFHHISQFKDIDRFVNDTTPDETEYTSYFSIAVKVIHI